MEQYVDKSTLVAEIERRIKRYSKLQGNGATEVDRIFGMLVEELTEFLSFIDTLGVKEVDLEKEIEFWRHNHFHGRRNKEASGEYLKRTSQLELAKYFFELGLKAQKGV